MEDYESPNNKNGWESLNDEGIRHFLMMKGIGIPTITKRIGSPLIVGEIKNLFYHYSNLQFLSMAKCNIKTNLLLWFVVLFCVFCPIICLILYILVLLVLLFLCLFQFYRIYCHYYILHQLTLKNQSILLFWN